ncbi:MULTISPECIES: segregation and condensation protein A [Nitrosomonas]|uniref:Segregation and condensation protein A n=2 Tax=Nitrosomonas eutropha TaxID=916 RepID=A0ABX5M8X7_9PROT|nr:MULTISPECIES: segregation/condensation protein A [Nitrosomonas]ABI60266.1 condensin subunit ScpA [Nitrosomonas eutropha C91]PXV81693.1 condensin subunit ScpA [Nitrosomonas eutropha]SCX11831.1 condensin subunit ScpA [Nitrosomonas eutropha]SDW73427.1 condensin subunit ScpA [Nitrosomonas eutropha]SEI72359.1 condensin subunit ScpA [Nitrosomonas eutropha]
MNDISRQTLADTGNILDNAALNDPIARVQGIPLLEIPQDLYIPPEALQVFLETFEGPLDLLLYLIRKHNLDILDIPMAELTRQYIAYVETMRADQLELAAEYLLMTALLIDIKSRMLLPHPAIIQEEEADPRAELVQRLLEYERIKQAAIHLHNLPLVGKDFMLTSVWTDFIAERQFPDVNPQDLCDTWLALTERLKLNRNHTIRYEAISVRACMSEILKNLQPRGSASFTELFSNISNIHKLVASFLALLELAREALVDIVQSDRFGTIYVHTCHSDRAN